MAYALDRTGARTQAASWGLTPNGRADVQGASALAPERLAGLVGASPLGGRWLRLHAQ